mgnify:CR=1 FL=1
MLLNLRLLGSAYGTGQIRMWPFRGNAKGHNKCEGPLKGNRIQKLAEEEVEV